MNGRGHVEPNPMVGCVLVKNGQIIGEGWHAKIGEAHAEPNALADCRARGNDPAGATAYVTLEPCCHTNKRTPPCAPRLIDAKIARVVIGCLDPHPDVDGKGVAMLRAAGIAVDVLPYRGMGYQPMAGDAVAGESRAGSPCHELDASHFRQLIAPFTRGQAATRPYVTLKWAESIDGKVAGAGGRPAKISGPAAQRLVHELRSRVDGILVGVNTVLSDDPVLNARRATRPRHPFRYVLDRDLRTPPAARVITGEGRPTTIYAQHDTSDDYRHRRDALEETDGLTVTPVPLDASGQLDLAGMLRRMRGMFIRELLVEPGPTLARSVFDADVGDRLWVFRSGTAIDDATAPRAATIPDHYVASGTLNLNGDTLTEYLNSRSSAFFAAVPSADVVLAAESAAGHAE